MNTKIKYLGMAVLCFTLTGLLAVLHLQKLELQKGFNMIQDLTFENIAGIDRVSEKWSMSSNWMYNILNGYITKKTNGKTIIKQRWGIKKVNASLGDLSNEVDYLAAVDYGKTGLTNNESGTGTIICKDIGAANSFSQTPKWYQWNTTDKNWDAKLSSYTTEYNTKVLIDNGLFYLPTITEIPMLPSGTEFTTDTTVDGYLILHKHNAKRYVFGVDSTCKVSRIGTRSNLASDTESFSTGFDSAELEISGNILDIQSIKENVVIFTDEETDIFYLPNVYENISLINSVKYILISPRASIKIGDEIFFATKSGISYFSLALSDNKQLDINNITSSISDYWDELVEEEQSFEDNEYHKTSPLVSFCFIKKLNHLLITVVTREVSINFNSDAKYRMTGSKTLVYSFETGSITGIYDFNLGDNYIVDIVSVENNVAYYWKSESSPEELIKDASNLYLLDNKGNLYISDEDQYTDAGNAIEFKIRPGYIGSSFHKIMKTLKEITFMCESYSGGDLKLSANYAPINDYTNPISLVYVTGTIVNITGVNFHKFFDFSNRFRFLDFQLTSKDLGERVSISNLNFKLNIEGEK